MFLNQRRGVGTLLEELTTLPQTPAGFRNGERKGRSGDGELTQERLPLTCIHKIFRLNRSHHSHVTGCYREKFILIVCTFYQRSNIVSYASASIATVEMSVCLYICLSITLWYCIRTNKAAVKCQCKQDNKVLDTLIVIVARIKTFY